MLTVRDAIPKPRDLAKAEFVDLAPSSDQDRRPRHRNRQTACASPSPPGCPEADLFRGLPGALAPLGP